MGKDFFAKVNEMEGEKNEAELTSRVRKAASSSRAASVEEQKSSDNDLVETKPVHATHVEEEQQKENTKRTLKSSIAKVEIRISEDKSNEKFVVVRVRSKESELFKELKYKYRKGAHEFLHRIVTSIDTKLINKSMLQELEEDRDPATSMRVLEEDYELIRKICYKKNLKQHEVIAIMCAMVVFK